MKNAVLKVLIADLERVISKHSELEIFTRHGIPYKLEGVVDVVDTDGILRGTFEIRVTIPSNYPNGFPSLRELSKLIPRTLDRHIYEGGNCCVTVLQQQMTEARRGISIDRYMSGYAIPFLANQIYFEEYGNWANGDYAHGFAGQLQYYEDVLKTSDPFVILESMRHAIKRVKVGRNQNCFCGSNKKFKNCHSEGVQDLLLIGDQQLIQDARTIFQFKIIEHAA